MTFGLAFLDLIKTSPADSPALCGGSHFLSWLSKMLKRKEKSGETVWFSWHLIYLGFLFSELSG